MFAQHMLAVCKPGGMMTTVMPHGVLFRGGEEKKIRQKFLEQDLIEAIIGLPPNLFYGAGIPACILVMRPNLTGQSPNPNKPAGRRGQVLFINADAEFHAGRAQNDLRPEHVEKIVSTFDRFEDVPGYARRVSLEEIGSLANDWNLNIRRYVDNSPPPEPHDVRAHLLGGVPVAEVQAKRPLFDALGFDLTHAFTARTNDTAYFDFATALADRSAIRTLVENDAGVQARIPTLRDALAVWWDVHAARLADLPTRRDLNAVRTEFLDSFVAALSPLGMLDRFKLAGVIATWWTDTLPDFKTLLENGFPGVIDGWVDAIADAVEDDEAAGPAFDPFAHKLVRHTMADYLNKIAAAKADIARLKGEKEAFEQSNAPDDADEEELASWNYARELERQVRELKAEHRDALKELTRLERAAARARATDADRLAAAEAKAALQPVFDHLASIETELTPYECIKEQLGEARARYRKLTDTFVDELKARCTIMSEDEKRTLVLELFTQDVQIGLDAAVDEKRQELARFVEDMRDKYRVTLEELHCHRASIERNLSDLLKRLTYT
jgi:type I restriction enzyme M protein